MDVREDSDDSDGSVVFVFHYQENHCDDNFSEHFYDIVLLKSLGIVADNHGNGLLCHVQGTVFVYLVETEIKGDPKVESLIGCGPTNTFFNECFN